MAFTFHQAGMEKQLLSQLSPPLAQALEQIAQSLPADFDRQASGIPAFFHNFMDGFWTPFEEVCQSDTEGLRKADQTSRFSFISVCSMTLGGPGKTRSHLTASNRSSRFGSGVSG